MNHSRMTLAVFLSLAALLFVMSSCVEENGSLYDPNADLGPQPTVSSIVSTLMPDSALADYDTLTITGTHFSPVAADNWVFFNSSVRSPYSATETEMRIRPPKELGSAVPIRVARRSSDLLSEPYPYKLGAAVETFGGVKDSTAHAMATDATGNLYVSISKSGSDAGIFLTTPAGVRTVYVPKTAGVVNWTGLRIGTGGYLYAVRNNRAIFRVNPGGGAASPWVQITSPAGLLFYDIEFDQNDNLWAAGNNASIFCIRPDRTYKASPFTANIRSLRVFNGYLYMSGNTATENQIWRAPIIGDSLGTAEVYFDFQSAYGSMSYLPNAITFSSDGFLYIATNSPEGIVIVSPSLSTSSLYGGYADLLAPSMRWLAWGGGTSLYGSSTVVVDPAGGGLLLRIQTRQTSAPYYGQ
jgi:hypothetical protein